MCHIVSGLRRVWVICSLALGLASCLEVERGAGSGEGMDTPAVDASFDGDGSQQIECQLDEDCVGKVVAGPCQRPDCQSGVCALAPDSSKTGGSCRDVDNLCLLGVCDEAGQCSNVAPVACEASGDPGCVTDACDPSTGQCSALFESVGTPCPTSLCLAAACDGSGDCVNAGVQAGEPCSTDTPCLDNGVCSEAGACLEQWVCPCTDDSECDDALDCTVDTCVDENCAFKPYEFSCAINGECYYADKPAPDDACRVCKPSLSQAAWTTIACDDDNPCTDDSCDSGEGCTHVAVADGTDCAGQGDCGALPSTCQAGSCACDIQCVLSDDCADNPNAPELPPCHRYKCDEGTCTTKADDSLDNSPCSASDPCLGNGLCSAGECDAQPIECGPCSTCTATSDTEYECQAASALNAAPCDDGDGCTESDVCSDGQCAGVPLDCTGFDGQCVVGACANGTCFQEAANAGNPCDDGVACTQDEVCTDGACTSPNPCTCSTSTDCDDGLTCTTGVCTNGSCSFPVDTGCAIDGLCVTEGEANAANGCLICDSARSTNTWSAVVCDDDNACTDDACTIGDGSCTFTPDDTNVCNDGEACSSDDACVDGACIGTVACLVDTDCNAQAPPACQRWVCQDCACVAEVDATQNGTSCDDGLFCTGGDQCAAGTCQGTFDTDCSGAGDGKCKQGVCDEGAGACLAVNRDAGVSCEDGDPCIVGETCSAQGVCDGELKDCSFLDGACTTGTCNSGTCVPVVSPAADCDDAEDCTTGDTCTATGACEGVWDSANCGCNDDNTCSGLTDTCNTGRCNLDTNECYKEPSGQGDACDDGDPCTAGDACSSAGTCQGTPYFCDDGKSCTSDSCDGAGGCLTELDEGDCIIDDQCRSNGELKDDNPCLVCDGTADSAEWSNNDGGACDDGDLCTDADTCDGGACQGTPYVCEDDELTCTNAQCGAGPGECEQVLAADFCLISGTCYPKNDGNPGFPCQVCRPSVSSSSWTYVGGDCDDGDPCTRNDSCSNGICAGESFSCNDNRSCTDDTCDGQGCNFEVIAGNCLIDGTCLADQTLDPTNPCRICDASAVPPTSWTNRPSGTSCEDGLTCTEPDTCDGMGICVPGGSTCTPDWCEDATCTSGSGCDITLKPNHCRIAGTCYQNGDLNPANACQRCSAANDTEAWTSATSSCDDGDPCTRDDTCSSGVCTGTPYTCDDGLACTTDTCDGAGTCEHEVAVNACVIAGSCYLAGELLEENGCRECDPNISQTGWTSLPDGSSCEGSGLSCAVAACQSGVCNETYDPTSDECFIGGDCYEDGSPNPQNECQVCEISGAPQAWTSVLEGQPCGDTSMDGCSASRCQQGSCVFETAPEFSGCDDGSSDTVGDWCVNGICGGFVRQTDDSHGQPLIPDRFERAARSGPGEALATWTKDVMCLGLAGQVMECTADVAISRFSGAATADTSVDLTFAQPVPLARHGLTEHYAGVGSEIFEFDGSEWPQWWGYTGYDIKEAFHGMVRDKAGALVERWVFADTDTLIVCENSEGSGCSYWGPTGASVAGFVVQQEFLYFVDTLNADLRVLRWGSGDPEWEIEQSEYLSGGGPASAVTASGGVIVIAGQKGTLFVGTAESSGLTKINVPGLEGVQSAVNFSSATTFNGRFVVAGSSTIAEDKFHHRALLVVHAPIAASSTDSAAWSAHEVDGASADCTVGCDWLSQLRFTGTVGLESSALYLFGAWRGGSTANQERGLWLYSQ